MALGETSLVEAERHNLEQQMAPVAGVSEPTVPSGSTDRQRWLAPRGPRMANKTNTEQLGESRMDITQLRKQCNEVVNAIELKEENTAIDKLGAEKSKSATTNELKEKALNADKEEEDGKDQPECKYNGKLGWLSKDTSGEWTKGSWSQCRPEGFNGVPLLTLP